MLRRIAVAAIAVFLCARSAPADDAFPRIVSGLTARSLGPGVTGGRITDLAVVESDPATFYVAAASGGVWKTVDGGESFTPVFDDQPTLSIGAVSVCQGKPETVYVGTGEANPRNSVQAGAGVFKSADGGKTWMNCGLAETHHIGRIAVHPTNPDIAYVAALGRVWGPNKERGLYKTEDGGKTWTLSKFLDENTGAVDVTMDPSNPDVLYFCGWQVRRDSFAGGTPHIGVGPSGGIFKTTDAGKTWTKLAGGLPERNYGRCGITIHRKNPNVVMAVVQTDKTPTGPTGQPDKEGNDASIGGIFRSEDAGKTWKKRNDLVPRPFYYGKIRIDPVSDQRVYVLGVHFFVSPDGGSTFVNRQATNVHLDHHALWVNPKNTDHLILGNDGGLYVSKDHGRTFQMKRGLSIGQFYGVAADSRTPYRVVGGLQDNGNWMGPTATPYADGIGVSDWFRVAGADGFQCAFDPKDPSIVYVESQFGGLMRVTLPERGPPIPKVIRPVVPKSEPFDRFNWNAPFLLSPHDSKTIYLGAQHVYKSVNRGDAWTKISPDLSRSPRNAPVFNGSATLSTLDESPVQRGVLWAGTDDGKVWLSKNDGKEWDDVGRNVKSGSAYRWVSKIEASHFEAGAAVLSLDRHRNDDFRPHIYSTADFGATWKPIANGLPLGAVVCTLKQSSKNKNLLFAGTEKGLFVSRDSGANWIPVKSSPLPGTVRIDDLAIHPRERELVIGTHGRGIWVMDIAPLEELTDAVLAADSHLFEVKTTTLLKPRMRRTPPDPGYVAKNPAGGLTVRFLTTEKTAGNIRITCTAADGTVIGASEGSRKPGLDAATFEVKRPGEYVITLSVGTTVLHTKKGVVRGEE
ncbi:MAG: hypothetical protein U0791_18845 [Gemmataceae bacterium]